MESNHKHTNIQSIALRVQLIMYIRINKIDS